MGSWKEISICRLLSQREALLITALGGVLRLYHLGESEFFGDEAFLIMRSVDVIWSFQGGELKYAILPLLGYPHPPMVMLAPIPSLLFLGVSEFSARLCSALVGSLTIYLVYTLAERLHDRRIGLLSASVFAICGVHVMFSRICLPPVFFLFFICLSINSMIRGNLSLASLTLGLAFLSEYTAVFSIPLLFYFLRRRTKKIHIKHLLPLMPAIFFYTIYLLIPLLLPSIFQEFFGGIKPGIEYMSERSIGIWTPNYRWMINFINYSGMPYFFFIITGILFSIISNLRRCHLKVYALWILPGATFFSFFVPNATADYVIDIWVPLTILGCFGWVWFLETSLRVYPKRVTRIMAVIILLMMTASTVVHVYTRTIRIGPLPFQIKPDSSNYRPLKEGWKTTGYFMREYTRRNDHYACVADGYVAQYYFDRKRQVLFDDPQARWWITQEEVFDPRFRPAAVVVQDGKALVFIYFRYWSKPVLVLDVTTYDRLFDEKYSSVSNIPH